MTRNILVKRLLTILTLCIGIALLFHNTTHTIESVHYEIASYRLPHSFNGFKIAQISDLHCIQSKKQADKLLDLLHQTNPDIIVFTGDIIDETTFDYSLTYTFLHNVAQIAPTYAVNGNHEAWLPELIYHSFEDKLNTLGIPILHNQDIKLTNNNDVIYLYGVDDPDFLDRSDVYANEIMAHQLDDIPTQSFTLLLSHRPELFDCYVAKNIDLVLTGHAHGGQIRLPFIGALLAPNQPLFPPYTNGVYTSQHTTMIVSTGIGTSKLPLRINNPSQVVCITLYQK